MGYSKPTFRSLSRNQLAFSECRTIRLERVARFGHVGLTGGMGCCRQLSFKCGSTKIACGKRLRRGMAAAVKFFRKCLREALSPLCASLLSFPARSVAN